MGSHFPPRSNDDSLPSFRIYSYSMIGNWEYQGGEWGMGTGSVCEGCGRRKKVEESDENMC